MRKGYGTARAWTRILAEIAKQAGGKNVMTIRQIRQIFYLTLSSTNQTPETHLNPKPPVSEKWIHFNVGINMLRESKDDDVWDINSGQTVRRIIGMDV